MYVAKVAQCGAVRSDGGRASTSSFTLYPPSLGRIEFIILFATRGPHHGQGSQGEGGDDNGDARLIQVLGLRSVEKEMMGADYTLR